MLKRGGGSGAGRRRGERGGRRGCIYGGWRRKSLGPSKSFETLTYISLNDQLGTNSFYSYWEQSKLATRYRSMPSTVLRTANAWPVGCILPLHNTVVSSLAQINLIKLVSCKTMIVSEERSPVVDSTLEEYQMRLLQVPRLGALRDETHPDYPFRKNLEDTWHETVGRITYLWHHWLSQAKCSDSWLGSKFWEATPVDLTS